MGPSRRLAPPGVDPSLLPPVDIVTVSHSHYDHMDLPSLRALAARGASLFVVPKDNASVLRGRAEDATLRADVATARAVAPLDRLAELAVRVVRPGGLVLAIKGQTADAELRKARPVLRRIGARGAEVVRAGQGKVDPATTVVRFFAR